MRNSVTGFYFAVDEQGDLTCDSATLNEACLFELFEWGDDSVSFKSVYNGLFLTDNGGIKCTANEPFGWFVKEKFRLERKGSDYVIRNWQDRFLETNTKSQLAVTPSLKPSKSSIIHVEIFSSGTQRVARTVTEAHNVVYFCGNNPLINARETMDRKHLDLPAKQQELLDTILKINADAVLFMVSGYPYAIRNENASAIMHTTHAGPAMGRAVAQTLFGAVSPAGRCPVTWYRSEDELCDIRDYNIIRTKSTYLYYDGEPLYPFGYGLSYTAFRYGSLRIDKRSFVPGEKISISFDVENIGGYDSEEVVQLYVSYPKLPLPLPVKQLKAFSRVFVQRGDAVRVTLELDVNDLAVWDPNIRDHNVLSGEYELQIGSSSVDIRRNLDIHVIASEYGGLDLMNNIPAVDCVDYIGVEYLADDELEEYALMQDWQSHMCFDGCIFKPCHAVEVTASNPASPVKLTFIYENTGAVVAECEIPSTGSLTEFKTVSASVNSPAGIGKLRIITSGMVSLKGFRFI